MSILSEKWPRLTFTLTISKFSSRQNSKVPDSDNPTPPMHLDGNSWSNTIKTPWCFSWAATMYSTSGAQGTLIDNPAN